MKKINNKVNLIIKLEGPAIEEGLNLFDLAPSLIAIGNVITESNKILNPEGREIAINIKPFEKGSFIIDLYLFAQTNFDQILSFISSDYAEQIKTLLEWIGLTIAIGGGGKGLIQLIKFLKSKPQNVEKLSSGDIRYTNKDGQSFTTNEKVNKLYNNCVIQNNTYQGFGKLLQQKGINEINTYIKGDIKSLETIKKEDVEALKNYSEISGEENIINESESVIFLKFKRGSFDGDGNNWSFRIGNKNIIVAVVKDDIFLKKVKSGEIRPNHKDTFEVILKTKQKIKNEELITSYEIMKVLKYTEAPKQMNIFNSGNPKKT
ncbi:MAG TPA: hypothetical protein VFD10_08155 [Atribacterota bacterium]|nr:hypothetical protein [Atribacterota bacterium]